MGLALASTNLAAVLDQQGRSAEAVRIVEEAATLFADASKSLDTNPEFQGHRLNYQRVHEAIRRHLDEREPRTHISRACTLPHSEEKLVN